MYLGGVQINNPVLDADSAPKSHDDGIVLRGISSESENIQNRVIERFGLKNNSKSYIDKLVFRAIFAIPLVDFVSSREGSCTDVGHFASPSDVVGTQHADSQQEEENYLSNHN